MLPFSFLSPFLAVLLQTLFMVLLFLNLLFLISIFFGSTSSTLKLFWMFIQNLVFVVIVGQFLVRLLYFDFRFQFQSHDGLIMLLSGFLWYWYLLFFPSGLVL